MTAQTKKYLIWAGVAIVVYLVISAILRGIQNKAGGVAPGAGGGTTTPPKFTCNPSAADRDKKISLGSKGNEVCYLQTWLNSYYSANLKVDGIFGSKTLSAIQKAKPGANTIAFSLNDIDV